MARSIPGGRRSPPLSECYDAQYFVDLVKELSRTVDAMKRDRPHNCLLASLPAHPSGPSTAGQIQSGSQFYSPVPGQRTGTSPQHSDELKVLQKQLLERGKELEAKDRELKNHKEWLQQQWDEDDRKRSEHPNVEDERSLTEHLKKRNNGDSQDQLNAVDSSRRDKELKDLRVSFNVGNDEIREKRTMLQRRDDEIKSLKEALSKLTERKAAAANQGCNAELQGLKNKLDDQEEMIEGRNVRIDSLEKDLKARHDAYGKLSMAHKKVLSKFEHATRILAQRSSCSNCMAGIQSRSISSGSHPPSSTTSVASDMEQSTEQQPSKGRKDESSATVDTVEFVSTRPVRHAKRASKKTGARTPSPGARPVKREPSPATPPSLMPHYTSMTQGLDLDNVDITAPTPRKSRHSSAPYDAHPSSPHSGTRNDGTVSFGSSRLDEASSGTQVRAHHQTERNPGLKASRVSGGTPNTQQPRIHVDEPDRERDSSKNRSVAVVVPSGTKDQPVLLSSQGEHNAPSQQPTPTRSPMADVFHHLNWWPSPSRRSLAHKNLPPPPQDYFRPISGDENTHNTPNSRASDKAKDSDKKKRKRKSHGAEKVDELAEDGDIITSSVKRQKKDSRLQSLLDSGAPETPRAESPTRGSKAPRNGNNATTSGMKQSTNRQPSSLCDIDAAKVAELPPLGSVLPGKVGKTSATAKRKLRDCSVDDLRLTDFVVNPSFLSRGLDRGRQHVTDEEWTAGFGDNNALRSRSPNGFWGADMATSQEAEAINMKGNQAVKDEIIKRFLDATGRHGRWKFRDE